MNKMLPTILTIILALPLVAQDKEEKDSSIIDAELINPLAEDAGEFLDLDLMETYGWKAYEAYQEGDYETSAKYYLAYLHYNTDDGGSIYNLACCYGLMGNAELAGKYLIRSIKAGFDDIEHVKNDPDFNPVRESELFAAVMDSLVMIADAAKAKEGKIVYIPADAYFKCHVQYPADFDPEKTYTLLVGLHGWGARPARFVQLWYRFGESPRFIYVAPQAPYAFEIEDMGYSWDTWIPDDSLLAADIGLKTEQYVLNVVDYFKDSYNIDNVFLTGFSQGGGYTYFIGLRNPDVFAGIMPLGGWMAVDWIGEETLTEAKDLPVFIGHGEQDMRVEFKTAKEAYKKLKKLKYDVTLFTFEGGHSVPEEECRALVEWMNTKR